MPTLSVIIPTHNRQAYAFDAVSTMATLPDVEVVVSDTSDLDSLGAMLAGLEGRERVVYDRPARKLDMVANYENGLRLSSGDFLVFLGDDDCLGPHAVEVARWAAGAGVEAVGCTMPASYGWPDFKSAYFGDGYAGKLAVRSYSGAARPLDGPRMLREALDNLGAGPLRMPRAYLGMISRELALRISVKYGRLFGGVSPDVFSAALISWTSQNTVLLDYPFVLPGSSGASASGAGATRRHVGKLREAGHLAAFQDLEWDSLIPEFYSVPTVWSYSLKKAVEAVGDDSLEPNYARLYAKCLLFHPDYRAETWAAIRCYAEAVGGGRAYEKLLFALAGEIWSQAQRVGRRVRHPRATGDAVSIPDIPTVGAAYRRLTEYAGAHGSWFAAVDTYMGSR